MKKIEIDFLVHEALIRTNPVRITCKIPPGSPRPENWEEVLFRAANDIFCPQKTRCRASRKISTLIRIPPVSNPYRR